MQQVESTVVMLEATRDVELRPGLVLPPGLYSGTETYTHLVGSGKNRTPSRFKIKLTAHQLADMGDDIFRFIENKLANGHWADARLREESIWRRIARCFFG